MATDYATLVPQPAPYHPQVSQMVSGQYQQTMSTQDYKKEGDRYPTPASENNSPNSASPTSPTVVMRANPPQIRPPKQPMYIPAAFRKTEPARQSPPKSSRVDTPIEPTDPAWSAFRRNSDMSRAPTLPKRYSGQLAPPTGPPKRSHWKPDSSTTVCTAPGCQRPFTLFNRRHHCRRCGEVVCNEHSQRSVPLDEEALFHPEGDFYRACDVCFEDFLKWNTIGPDSDRPQESSVSGESTSTTIATPTPAKRPENTRVGSLATSFQGAWNWSTF